MVTFGVALYAGLWFIGRRVIAAVGHNLTTLHPASGLLLELSAAGSGHRVRSWVFGFQHAHSYRRHPRRRRIMKPVRNGDW